MEVIKKMDAKGLKEDILLDRMSRKDDPYT